MSLVGRHTWHPQSSHRHSTIRSCKMSPTSVIRFESRSCLHIAPLQSKERHSIFSQFSGVRIWMSNYQLNKWLATIWRQYSSRSCVPYFSLTTDIFCSVAFPWYNSALTAVIIWAAAPVDIEKITPFVDQAPWCCDIHAAFASLEVGMFACFTTTSLGNLLLLSTLRLPGFRVK